VFTPTLTGLADRSHLLRGDINLDTHIADIVNLVRWEDLDRIVLAGHSYAGFPVCGAIELIFDRVASGSLSTPFCRRMDRRPSTSPPTSPADQ
jgi:hypothetical protein